MYSKIDMHPPLCVKSFYEYLKDCEKMGLDVWLLQSGNGNTVHIAVDESIICSERKKACKWWRLTGDDHDGYTFCIQCMSNLIDIVDLKDIAKFEQYWYEYGYRVRRINYCCDMFVREKKSNRQRLCKNLSPGSPYLICDQHTEALMKRLYQYFPSEISKIICSLLGCDVSSYL